MRLGKVKGTYELGRWLQSKGVTPSGHKAFGPVGTHSTTSLHYQLDRQGNFARDKQGNLAIDANDNDVSSEKWHRKIRQKFGLFSEKAVLKYVYHRIKRTARRKRWPLNEMFFNGYGYMVEYGYDRNHPIGSHETHLHIGFSRSSW